MDAQGRRDGILQRLRSSHSPISASQIAGEMGVSRQVIVGDIALLRAQGHEIIATARGYSMIAPAIPGRYIGKLACQHSLADTQEELLAIVRLGGEILDVVVEHYLYGEITGQLNLTTEHDVYDFTQKLKRNEVHLLSELTGGVHLHTVSCKDQRAFEAIYQKLEELNLLYKEQ